MIAPGTKIGVYEIVREVGRGGMGVVFLARDTKLDRNVAIKALPEHMADDPERLARFEREAKTLAQLNHPNVAQIFGVEELEGRRFLVLEYVEGETLAERLDSGPLTIDETLEVCAEIAAGVGAAHEAGVVHRDLKPANIKFDADGKPKVLDFGLAKAGEGHSSSSMAASELATLSQATRPGAILGTAPYMSPEQARGRTVDKRTDIWSFGVVMYECLTGMSPFAGETMTDSLGAILHRDMNWELLPSDTPPIVRLLLRRCLQRDRKKRLQDINDARVEIEEAIADPSASTMLLAGDALEEIGARRGVKPLWLAAAVLLGAVATGAILTSLWPAPPEPVPMRFQIELMPGGELRTGVGPDFAVSPDGARIAFAVEVDEEVMLYVRDVGSDNARQLTGTQDAEHPFFSPNGDWIGFFTDDNLKKVSVHGGTPIVLAPVNSSHRGGTWLDDGTIVFAPSTTSGLHAVPDSGGTPETITSTDSESTERSHRWPSAVPDRRQVVFTSETYAQDFNESLIEVLDLDTGERHVLHKGGTYGLVTPGNVLLFAHDGTMFASALDSTGTSLIEPPLPVLYDLHSSSNNGGAQIALSDTGMLVYVEGLLMESDSSMPTWVGFDGSADPVNIEPDVFDMVRLSPDGTRVAFARGGEFDGDIVVYELARGIITIVAGSDADEFCPLWSPDGRRIAYTAESDDAAIPSIFVIDADGESPPRRVTTATLASQYPSAWSPDGSTMLFVQNTEENSFDIFSIRVDDDEPVVETVLSTPAFEGGASFRSDGEWIVYVSRTTGEFEVFIRRLDGPSNRRQVSIGGGGWPEWSPDGLSVFYSAESEDDDVEILMRVDLTEEGGVLSPSNPVEVVRYDVLRNSVFRKHALDLPNERVMVLQRADPKAERKRERVHVVLNWFDQLNDR